jgi:hypothetical protein
MVGNDLKNAKIPEVVKVNNYQAHYPSLNVTEVVEGKAIKWLVN